MVYRSARLPGARLSAVVFAVAWLAFIVPSTACAATPPPVAAARPIGPDGGRLIQNAGVVGRDQGASASLDGIFPGMDRRSAWIFGDTVLARDLPGADCDHLATDTQAYSDLDLSAGIRVQSDVSDATGAPMEFLPFTRAEGLYNAMHHTAEHAPCTDAPQPSHCRYTVNGTCDAEYLLNAGPVIADAARRRLLLFFDVAWRLRQPLRQSPNNGDTIGAGIATWAANQRPELRRLFFTGNPSTAGTSPYAFGNGRPPSDDPHPHGAVDYSGPQYNQAPVIPPGQSRYLYLYDTIPPSRTPDCGLSYCYKTKLARVPLATLTNVSTWRYYDASRPAHPWQPSILRATYLPSADTSRVTSAGPPNFSVTYNAYLRKYVMFYQEVLTRLIGYRTAQNPWGPWSAQGTLPFQEVAPGPGGIAYAAQAHDEFSNQRGKIMYLTYVASNTPGSIYAVKVVFR